MPLDGDVFRGGDPKPVKAVKERPVRGKRAPLNVACVACGERATNRHHLVPKAQGGEDVPENTIPLCGQGNASGCHRLIHESDVDVGVAIRSVLSDVQVAYVVGVKGVGWLDLRYPESALRAKRRFGTAVPNLL